MMEQFGIEGIYIVHVKNGYEVHEARINKLFKAFGLNFEFVTDGAPTAFGSGILNNYFVPDIRNLLTDGVLSCTLNHILCYEKIVKNNNRYALVFENDPFFIGDFVEKIKKIIIEANALPEGFIISLENTTLEFPSTKNLQKGKLLYEADHGRCAGAYLMDLKAAKNILQDLQTNKCEQVIDWWHNTLIKNNVVKMYWADPPLTEQGSHNGLLYGTISSKNKNTGRRIAWLAQKYYKTYIRRWFK